MILRFGQQIRDEGSENVIATLKRKGWVEVEIPKHDRKTQQIQWIDGVPEVVPIVDEPDPELGKGLLYVIRFFASKLGMTDEETADLIKVARRRARG